MRTALTCYVLTLAVFIPMSPWLCDRFGTRRVFGGAILVFSFGSLLCGLAQSLPQLVMARVVQGLGGAALMPVGRYVLVRSIDRREFVSAMTTVATFGLLGSVFGPLLGGALVEFTNWRLIFLINVPVGIGGLLLNRREMPDYRLGRGEPLRHLRLRAVRRRLRPDAHGRGNGRKRRALAVRGGLCPGIDRPGRALHAP